MTDLPFTDLPSRDSPGVRSGRSGSTFDGTSCIPHPERHRTRSGGHITRQNGSGTKDRRLNLIFRGERTKEAAGEGAHLRQWSSLSPATPATINTRHTIRPTEAGSPNATMPYTAAPIAPIPTHTA
ncbi:hypothetical protein LX15_000872 [Streptoalloteichus tenebrarius]|uniref:Uncharacterized protein n=1 Tax=Streptoalloteichus tenebrarius (strain ATCC 17920 / DSM 40477 / JCM 4838 / CBS 697.72 / NBRC 16177 / NCIMB 11028 / NRRL B-12390 / A12253. 1 / ISP 5477) TaxID=1933 RepID=A0ABT1HNU8_STRSD|nr:hypothetical protein [Streptoalloteichus tenebrarius]